MIQNWNLETESRMENHYILNAEKTRNRKIIPKKEDCENVLDLTVFILYNFCFCESFEIINLLRFKFIM